MGAIAAGDVGIDGQIAPRLQGHGTVQTAADRHISRSAKGDVTVIAGVGRSIQGNARTAINVDIAGRRHSVNVDLATGHRQTRKLGGAAHRTPKLHRTAAGVHRQRPVATRRRVHRRGERDGASRGDRHIGVKVHRTGERDGAGIAPVTRPVQINALINARTALDGDGTGRRHSVKVDLTAGHRQTRKLGGAAHRTPKLHRTAAGVHRQRPVATRRRVHRRGERDGASRGNRHIGVKVHRTGERDGAGIAPVARPVQINALINARTALDGDGTGRRHSVNVDLATGHRQTRKLGGAAHRTPKLHRTAAGVHRQRPVATRRRVHRRGERDGASRGDRHIGVKVHRTGERDGAGIAPVTRPVQINALINARTALDGDGTGRRHSVKVDLTAGHRQTRKLGGAAHRTPKLHRTAAGVHRQRPVATRRRVHRRGERDGASRGDRHIGVKVHRTGERDGAGIAPVTRPVQINALINARTALDGDGTGRRHSVNVDLATGHRQTRKLGGAAHRTPKLHRTAAGVHRQRPVATRRRVHRRGERDGASRGDRHIGVKVHRTGERDGAGIAPVTRPVQINALINARTALDGDGTGRRHSVNVDLATGHRQTRKLGGAAHRTPKLHRTAAGVHRQRPVATRRRVHRRGERDGASRGDRHIGVKVHRTGERDGAGIAPVTRPVQINALINARTALDGDGTGRRHSVKVDLTAGHRQTRKLGGAAHRTPKLHRTAAGVHRQRPVATRRRVHRRGERDGASRGDRHIGVKVHRTGERDGAGIAPVTRPVQINALINARTALDGDGTGRRHSVKVDLTAGHRQTRKLGGAAHRTPKLHRTAAGVHRQRPVATRRRVHRRGERDGASRGDRHIGVKVHRTGERDGAGIAPVTRPVQINALINARTALDGDGTGRRHSVNVDLATGHRQTRKLGGAAHRTPKLHRTAAGVHRQRPVATRRRVHRRGERDGASRGDRHIGVKVHRTGERDGAGIAPVTRPVQINALINARTALDGDGTGRRHSVNVDLATGHRQTRKLGGAAHRTPKLHRTAAGVHRQRPVATRRRVHRRGERDGASRGDRHIGVKVHRTGERDGAGIAPVTRPVQINALINARTALDGDGTGRRHSVNVDLATGHRQTRKLGGAAHRTPKLHRTAAGVHRQRPVATRRRVHRRGERDGASRGDRHIGVKVHRTGERDGAGIAPVTRPVQINALINARTALDGDGTGRRHSVNVDLATGHRQTRKLGGAAHRTPKLHRTAAGVHRQRPVATRRRVHRRGERDGASRGDRHIGVKVHRTGERDGAGIAPVTRPVQINALINARTALDGDGTGRRHSVNVDLATGHRQTRKLGGAAHRTPKLHRTAAGVHRQRPVATRRRVHRRGERDGASRGDRHIGVKVHRTGERDGAGIAPVTRPVQINALINARTALDGDGTGRRHSVKVDLTAGHRQTRKLGGAAHRTPKLHRTAAGVHRQRPVATRRRVHRRGERDGASRGDRHIGVKVHRTGERDGAGIAPVTRPVQINALINARTALDGDGTGRRHSVNVDLATGHRQTRKLGGAAHRTPKLHRTAAGVHRQRPVATRRRVHRRGERDGASRGDRHIGVKVHRTGERDGAGIAPVARPVQINALINARTALDGDGTGRRHSVEVDLTTVHRQTRQRRRGAHRTLKRHRTTAVGVQRQPIAAVHRRFKCDCTVVSVFVHIRVHRHVRSQGHCARECDIAIVGRDICAQGHCILECDIAIVSRDFCAQRRSTAGIQNQRCTAADGQNLIYCDGGCRYQTASTSCTGWSRCRCPNVDRARSGECADFRTAQIARRRIADYHRSSRLRRRDMEVTRSGIDAARRIDFKPGTNQRDVTIVRCDDDSAGNLQRSGAIVIGRSGRIRLKDETMSAHAAGDVGIDGEMATRLQGQDTVRTSAHVNQITYRYVSPSSQNKRCTAADGQSFAYCDAARRDRTARTARSGRSGRRSPDVNRARSGEPPDFSIAQIGVRRCADRHRNSARRRDMDVPRSSVYAARRIDFKPGTNQRDVTVIRCDRDSAGNLQRSGAIVAGQSGRIRLEDQTMGAIAAGDVGIDVEISTRLQGHGTVRTAADRHISRSAEGDVAVIAGVGRSIQGNARTAINVDIAGRRHSVKVDLTAGHRQTRKLGGAAHRTLKCHRNTAGVHRQLMSTVHRRGEPDGAARRIAVHRHIAEQVHRTGEGDGAIVNRDIRTQLD